MTTYEVPSNTWHVRTSLYYSRLKSQPSGLVGPAVLYVLLAAMNINSASCVRF